MTLGDIIYTYSLAGEAEKLKVLMLRKGVPEQVLLHAVEACREKGWAGPLDALMRSRAGNGKGDSVLNAALRARKSLAPEPRGIFLRPGTLKRLMLRPPETVRGRGGISGSGAGAGRGSRRVAAPRQ